MGETFFGELPDVNLFDILKALLSEKKTGVLAVRGRETGEIYLEKGDIVHATTLRLAGEEAFLAVMAWRAGKSSFIPGRTTDVKTISIPPEQLILKWSYRKHEWVKIREIIPSGGVVLRLSLQKDAGERSIRSDEWNVLALANGIRTAAEIADAIGWDEFKTYRTLYELVKAGLLEKVGGPFLPRIKKVGDGFFARVEHELKKVMGPVAPFLVDEKLEELGERKDSLLEDQAKELVRLLGEEIPDEDRREHFLKSVGTPVA